MGAVIDLVEVLLDYRGWVGEVLYWQERRGVTYHTGSKFLIGGDNECLAAEEENHLCGGES